MFGFSELEEKILGENGDAVLKDALETVRTIETEATDAIASGLSPDDHAAAEAIVTASRAAHAILTSPIPKDGV